MQKQILLDMIAQNESTSWAVFNKVTEENADLRLNPKTASAGFIYRHIGETFNRFGFFFGIPTDVQNTTMGKADEGQGRNLEESRLLVEGGYAMLRKYVENTPDLAWQDPIETPFFGTVTRARLFSHVLFHNSYHAGQIALTLKKGAKVI
jgi:uncharacterized damage-inducible protein DinB